MRTHTCLLRGRSTNRLRTTTRSSAVVLLIAILVLAELRPQSAAAAPGDLDPAFGTAGTARTDFGGSERVTAQAIQPDSKLLTPSTDQRSGIARTYAGTRARVQSSRPTLDTYSHVAPGLREQATEKLARLLGT